MSSRSSARRPSRLWSAIPSVARSMSELSDALPVAREPNRMTSIQVRVCGENSCQLRHSRRRQVRDAHGPITSTAKRACISSRTAKYRQMMFLITCSNLAESYVCDIKLRSVSISIHVSPSSISRAWKASRMTLRGVTVVRTTPSYSKRSFESVPSELESVLETLYDTLALQITQNVQAIFQGLTQE